jgi:small subunit ribosomal protein S17
MKQENKKKTAKENDQKVTNQTSVATQMPVSIRGRIFEGYVSKKFPKRVVIEFERPIYNRKYERYLKAKTKLHARLPTEMESEIIVGDFIQIRECRPLSKIIHFMVVKKIRSAGQEHANKKTETEEKQ